MPDKIKTRLWFDPGEPEPAMPAWMANFLALYKWEHSWSGTTSSWAIFTNSEDIGPDQYGGSRVIAVRPDVTLIEFLKIVNTRHLK